MTARPRITVLGAGSWGTALALALNRNGCHVNLWDRDTHGAIHLAETRQSHYLADITLPNSICVTHDLAQAVHDTTAILVVVPSHGVRPLLEKLRPHLSATQGICLASKGLEPESSNLLHQVVYDILGEAQPLAILSGPSFAKEVAHGMITALTIAGTDQAFNETLQTALQSDSIRIYTNQDIIGVQIGGAVKNVLAIAAGIGEGLGAGANARAAMITRGLAEMIRLGEALGAKRDTLIGLTGLGDLLLTCSDNQSRNRRFGLALGQGKDKQSALHSIGQIVEGERNSQEIYTLAKRHHIEMPIVTQVYRVLFEGISPKEGLSSLLTRDALGE